MTLTVWHHLLVKGSRQWRDRADELYAARSTLLEAQTGLLGPRVGAVAEGFVAEWADRLGELHERARTHSDALSSSATDFADVEEEVVAGLQRLLSWQDRDAGPRSGG